MYGWSHPRRAKTIYETTQGYELNMIIFFPAVDIVGRLELKGQPVTLHRSLNFRHAD
jgi:hypothetical protein